MPRPRSTKIYHSFYFERLQARRTHRSPESAELLEQMRGLLGVIMHRPNTARGPIGLGGMMNNVENDSRDTQRVDEVQPLLVILLQKIGLRTKPLSVEDQGAFTLPGCSKMGVDVGQLFLVHDARERCRRFPIRAKPRCCPSDVNHGSEADIPASLAHFPLTTGSRHRPFMSTRPRSAP